MSAQAQKPKGGVLTRPILLSVVSAVVLAEAPSFYFAGYDVIEIAAYGGLIYSVPPLIAEGLNWLANKVERCAANIPDGNKGMARWAKYADLKRSLLHSSIFRRGHGAYWGMLDGRGLFTTNPSVSLVVGSNGSGKDTTHGDINILSTPGSKFILDFKGDLAVKHAPALLKRGERVHVLNVDDVFAEFIGLSDNYNVLHHIADCFTEGSILHVSGDVTELAMAIYPEPEGESKGPNGFFRIGSRKLIKFAATMCILIDGESATLADILSLLQDRERLLHYARWVSGRLEHESATSFEGGAHA